MEKQWIDSQKENLLTRRAELDKIEDLLDKICLPSKSKKDAALKLKNLFEWWGMIPQHGPFPTRNIMEELLMDQEYKVFSYPNGKETFVVNDFEMELILSSSSNYLKVKRLGLEALGRDVPLPARDKRFTEFDILMQTDGRLEIARKLTKLSFLTEPIGPTLGESLKRTWKNYINYPQIADEINENFKELIEEDKKRNDVRREEANIETAKGLISIKESGLFETFELISRISKCIVIFDIFIGTYSINNGIKEANDFVEKHLNKGVNSMEDNNEKN